MSDGVWISSLLSNGAIGYKQGLRDKEPGDDWTPATFEIPLPTPENLELTRKYARGIKSEPHELPEAAAVWDPKSFKRNTGQIFTAAARYVVRRKLHDVLSRFDLGEGGLVPFTIYEADLETPLEEEFWLLNFGAIKETFLPEQSDNVQKRGVQKNTGLTLWRINGWHEDNDIAVSDGASAGADLWFERVVDNKIFMSGALVAALQQAKLDEPWMLKRCRVVGDAA